MMGPDSAFLGITDRAGRMGSILDTLVDKGREILDAQVAKYTQPGPAVTPAAATALTPIAAALPSTAPAAAGTPLWMWVVGGIGALGVLGGIVYYFKKK